MTTYRMLKPHESLEQGDQFLSNVFTYKKTWVEVDIDVHRITTGGLSQWPNYKYRRPVKEGGV